VILTVAFRTIPNEGTTFVDVFTGVDPTDVEGTGEPPPQPANARKLVVATIRNLDQFGNFFINPISGTSLF